MQLARDEGEGEPARTECTERERERERERRGRLHCTEVRGLERERRRLRVALAERGREARLYSGGRGEVGVLATGPRRSCYSDTGMLAMPLSKVNKIRDYPRFNPSLIG